MSSTFNDYTAQSGETAVVSPMGDRSGQGFFSRDSRFQQRRVVSSPARSARSKRRFSEDEDSFKKVRQDGDRRPGVPAMAATNGPLTLQNINLEEYAKFEHPDGGYIQFTPVGNVRTFLSDNNVMQRVVEQHSSFDLAKKDCGIDGYKIHMGDHGFEGQAQTGSVSNSSSNETEGYMRSGYAERATGFYDGGCSASRLDYFLDDEDFDEDDDDMMQ